jgi:hypothetical protein
MWIFVPAQGVIQGFFADYDKYPNQSGSSLIAVHMIVFGVNGWLTPQEWPWKLPPISLLAFAAAAFPLIVKFWNVISRQNL